MLINFGEMAATRKPKCHLESLSQDQTPKLFQTKFTGTGPELWSSG